MRHDLGSRGGTYECQELWYKEVECGLETYGAMGLDGYVIVCNYLICWNHNGVNDHGSK